MWFLSCGRFKTLFLAAVQFLRKFRQNKINGFFFSLILVFCLRGGNGWLSELDSSFVFWVYFLRHKAEKFEAWFLKLQFVLAVIYLKQ